MLSADFFKESIIPMLIYLITTYDVLYFRNRHFPLVEPPPGASGHITNIGTNLCLDGKFGGSGAPVQLSPCQKNGAEMVSRIYE